MEFSQLQMAGAGVSPTLATDSLVYNVATMQRKEGDWPNSFTDRPPSKMSGLRKPPGDSLQSGFPYGHDQWISQADTALWQTSHPVE